LPRGTLTARTAACAGIGQEMTRLKKALEFWKTKAGEAGEELVELPDERWSGYE